MKPKKSAFANTSTGYGRHHKHGSGKSNNNHNSNKSSDKNSKSDRHKFGHENEPQKEEQDKDLNSGFGDYLRTPEAFEMMKLFVFANTVMLIVTMAWPHITEQFYMLNEWWESFRSKQNI